MGVHLGCSGRGYKEGERGYKEEKDKERERGTSGGEGIQGTGEGYKERETGSKRGAFSKPLNNLPYILVSPLMWKEQNAGVLAPAIHHVSVNLQNNE